MVSSGVVNKIWKRAEPAIVSVLHYIVGSGRRVKLALIIANDAILCVLAVWIAFSLRLGGWVISSPAVLAVIVASIAAWLPIFLLSGIYRSVVRYMGSRTMIGIATSCIMISAVLAIFIFLNVVPGIPRTIAAIQPMVFAGLLIFSRLVARYILFDLLNQRNFTGQRHRVLIYGAGSSGRQLALSLRHEGNMILRGYIDDDLRVAGKHLDGVRVYRTSNLADLIDRLAIDMVLLAVPRVSRQQREQMVRKFEDISVRVLTLPAIGNLLDGSVSVGDLRAIEITDLLGRDPVPPNHHLLHRTVTGRSVMVTGAGGSIGSELCRQISRLEPLAIILVEMTEHALYSIETELREAEKQGIFGAGLAIHAELGSIADMDTARRLFDRWRPETVFHAAAYKHVPLVEENVIAGLRNNIIGTLNCALQADRTGVQNFILVSTDKAVRPTNVMGASKRICELVLQALNVRGSQTLFAIVRFGNVLGSSGSVVPRFQRQIRQGGPVTLTHRDVTRYFMTIPEAAQLVIQAGAMAEGGEVYVLDMGEPIRIYDLARTMINLSGLSVRDAAHPEGDIEICEVGLRKGEKLYEELLIGNSPRPTDHARIMQAREDHLDWPVLAEHLATLQEALADGNRQRAVDVMCTLVPEYSGTHAR